MSTRKQRTIGREISLEGVGIHSGEAAVLTLRPAESGTGIHFRRSDLDGAPSIPADLDHVVDLDLGTTIGEGEARVLTVEHTLAALAAQGVDNVVVDLTGPEPPIRDGSFADYFAAIDEAGLVEQDEMVSPLRLDEPVSVELDSGESYVAAPASEYRISATIDFAHPTIGRQHATFPVRREVFAADLARARTFGFRRDAETLRERGLAKGASLENTVVLDDDGVLGDGLRWPDEFLRHKVGDLIGDLALTGAPIVAHIVADRPSHKGNVALARAIVKAAGRSGRRPIVDAAKIMEYLPHRFPMLLVDRIIDYEDGKRIVGIKNVTINEPFFQGHYPGHPIMPGVLIIEAMAQVGGLLLMDAVDRPEDKVVYFMSLDNVKWRRPVTPGDQIVFELEMVQFRRHVCKMRGTGTVDGELVAEADLMARIVDR